MLRPIENAYRDCRRLDGIWRFVADQNGLGTAGNWQLQRLENAIEMPVPASFNDIYPDAALRDHVGDVWYQRDILIPKGWIDQRIGLRFDSATHRATVWLEQTEVARHEGGYTPFEADISDLVQPGKTYRLTVRINNELTWDTIPPGQIVTAPSGRRTQQVFHDFFNYAGLQRSVWLTAAPLNGIADLDFDAGWANGDGWVDYRVTLIGDVRDCRVALIDATGQEIASAQGASGKLVAEGARPWKPGEGYLHRLRVETAADRYETSVGLRTVRVDGTQLLINGEPFYFRGFGRHEDSVARGKGHDDSTMLNDYALMAWTGANSFRTSHYPYAEEQLDYADRHGLVVISETEAVGLNVSLGLSRDIAVPAELYSDEAVSTRTQANHIRAIRELIARDKHHPSVVMWSLANEPDVRPSGARDYFAPLIAEARRLDPSRPITVVNVQFCGPEQDPIADLLDVLCLNRYYGWYWNGGDLDSAERALETELNAWAAKHRKPIIITEYGADAAVGLHAAVPMMWSEDYQVEVLDTYHRVFDRCDFVIGEQVWNFADFATSQGAMRVGGNRKGVFTRDRQPKAAARLLRRRWLSA